jgi:glutamine synthetase
MVGTLMLKDTSDHTAFKVFEPDQFTQLADSARFAGASNLVLKPDFNTDPAPFYPLPWSPGSAWLFAQPFFADGTPTPFDSRRVLQVALDALRTDAGYAMRCGLEIEFHIYKIEEEHAALDPDTAAWPGLSPRVSLLHPGYQLLSDAYTDRCHAPLDIVRQTALGLGLPLTSLEIEFGPSQFEAVFDVQDALAAADQMVRFTNGVRQALRRAGYHATFMCRPPFPQIMSSGWHLHQSLVDVTTGEPLPPSAPTHQHYLAGLLAHGRAMSALAAPSVSSYARYQPNVLAPQTVSWGTDNRAAMLRLLSNRIENRVGEPMANPYLYIASQIYAGLDGMARQLVPPMACDPAAEPLPTSLGEALDALLADEAYIAGFGREFVRYYDHVKRFEIARYEAADDKPEWIRREYFNRF